MVDSINVTGLTIAGRIDAPDPKNGQVAIQKNLDMATAKSYSIDFTSMNQAAQIGVIRTMFADNSNNPSEIAVTALGTGQRFTIPAFAEGYFPIVSRLNAGIVLESDGGASKPVTIIFFNYDFPIGVWYKYGAVNKDVAQKVQGSLPDGADVGGQYGNGNLVAGKTPDGKVKTVNVDANGNIVVSNLDITIGSIYGPDAVGVAPTHPGVLTAVLDSDGKVKNLALTADSELTVVDAKVLDKLTAIASALNANKGSGSAVTKTAATTGDAQLLALNANRRGASVFNDSTAILYLLLADAVATNDNYSVQVEAGGYYELPAGYTGKVKATWANANGAARVTEFA